MLRNESVNDVANVYNLHTVTCAAYESDTFSFASQSGRVWYEANDVRSYKWTISSFLKHSELMLQGDVIRCVNVMCLGSLDV